MKKHQASLALGVSLFLLGCTTAWGQRFSYHVNVAVSYNTRYLTVDERDTMAVKIKKTQHDPYDKPAVSYKIGMDARYKLTEKSLLSGSLSLLNYRDLQKRPSSYIPPPPGFVGGTEIPATKYIHNYYYLQAGIGYQHSLGRKMFIGGMLNADIPLFYIYTLKQGRLSNSKFVYRSLEKKNDPSFEISPEIIAGRDFAIADFPFSVYVSGQYFINPLYNRPIKAYPIFGHVGCMIPLTF